MTTPDQNAAREAEWNFIIGDVHREFGDDFMDVGKHVLALAETRGWRPPPSTPEATDTMILKGAAAMADLDGETGGEATHDALLRAALNAMGSTPEASDDEREAREMLGQSAHPDDMEAAVLSLTFQRHYIDTLSARLSPDNHSSCICGEWSEGEMEPGWDDHLAEVAVTAGFRRSPVPADTPSDDEQAIRDALNRIEDAIAFAFEGEGEAWSDRLSGGRLANIAARAIEPIVERIIARRSPVPADTPNEALVVAHIEEAQELRARLEQAREAWWSATEQGEKGVVYTDRIESAMDDIWSEIGDATWTPVAARPTPPEDVAALVDSLRRDSGDYGRVKGYGDPAEPGELLSWGTREERAWHAAAALAAVPADGDNGRG